MRASPADCKSALRPGLAGGGVVGEVGAEVV